MARRYAFAQMLFNVSGLAPLETVETEGPGAPAARSRPAPARTERVHDAGAGRGAGGCLPGPSHFSRVAEAPCWTSRNQPPACRDAVAPQRSDRLRLY
jgi:hypothetical protein